MSVYRIPVGLFLTIPRHLRRDDLPDEGFAGEYTNKDVSCSFRVKIICKDEDGGIDQFLENASACGDYEYEIDKAIEPRVKEIETLLECELGFPKGSLEGTLWHESCYENYHQIGDDPFDFEVTIDQCDDED